MYAEINFRQCEFSPRSRDGKCLIDCKRKKSRLLLITFILSRFPISVFRLFTQTQLIFKGAVTHSIARFYAKLRAYNNAPRAIHNQGAHGTALHRVAFPRALRCDTRHARKRLYNLQRPPGAIGFSSTGHLWLGAISHSDRIRARRIYLDVASPRSDRGVTQVRYGPLHGYEVYIIY